MIPKEKRINSKKELREWLLYEKSKYKFNKFNIFSEQRIAYKYNVLLRKTEYYTNSNKHYFLKQFFKIRLSFYQNKYSIRIPINTFEKGLKIMHIGPILVNGNASVGKDCAIHINTALVAKGTSSSSPSLGDGCVIGIGAIIVGDVYVADNIAIGANSTVTKSFFEKDIAVGGVPAEKISNNGRTKWIVKKG